MGNMIGMPNYAIALGSFAGGKVWIEDEQGTSLNKVVMKKKFISFADPGWTCTTIQCPSTCAGSTKSSHM